MLVSVPPAASSVGSVEANRSRSELASTYNGLMPSRSRPRITWPLACSTIAKANMPRKWSTKFMPQWAYALPITSVSEVEKNR